MAAWWSEVFGGPTDYTDPDRWIPAENAFVDTYSSTSPMTSDSGSSR